MPARWFFGGALSSSSLMNSGTALRRSSFVGRYVLLRLTRFMEDGRLELDTNPVENQIRPIALTRKNALFAGHEVSAENWAMLASLVATCKMSDVNPVDYLADTLSALLDGLPKSRIEVLMPWQFRRASSLAA